jgi:hypothetical protein
VTLEGREFGELRISSGTVEWLVQPVEGHVGALVGTVEQARQDNGILTNAHVKKPMELVVVEYSGPMSPTKVVLKE